MVRSRLASRFCPLALLACLAGPLAAQDGSPAALTELFVKAKAQFRGGGYEESLATLARLEKASDASGLEAVREKLGPAIAFYRGANLAALGRAAEAKKEFQVYLASASPARLDPSMYPKSVVHAFNEARDETRAAGEPGPRAKGSEESGLAGAYERFRGTPPAAPVAVDERWADGAVRFLMTASEKEEWKRLSDPVARSEFVALFWQQRDPTPETPENEYRTEVERRLQFADKAFADGEKRGSETDRGMVFVLMGPPTSAGQRPIKSEDDPIQTSRSAPTRELVMEVNGRVAPQATSRDAMTAERIQGTREFWHYGRDRLPSSVRFNELDFEFLTKPGYGTAVLQREPNALSALELAVHPAAGSSRN